MADDGAILFEADLDEQKLMDGLRNVDKGLDKLGKRSKTTGKKVDALSKSTVQMNRMFRTFAAGYIISQLEKLGGAAVSIAAKYEILDVRMATAFRGSAEAAQYAIGWTRNFATEVPASLDTVTDKFILLQTAGLNPMSGAMQSLFDASNKAGGGLEKLNPIMNSVIKANTVGRMGMEEFRMAMDAGVPAIDLMADALGKSNSKILEMSRRGELGRKEIALLIEEMGKWGEGASLDMMEATTGKLINIVDLMEKMTVSFMSEGALQGVVSGIDEITKALEELQSSGKLAEMGQEFGTFVNKSADQIPKIVDGIERIISVASDLIPVAKTVGEAMLLMYGLDKLRSFSALLTAIPGKISGMKSSAMSFDKIATSMGVAVIAGQALARLLDEINTEHLKSGFTAGMDESMSVMMEWKAAIESDTEAAESLRDALKEINAAQPQRQQIFGSRTAPISMDIAGLAAFDEKSASADQWLKWFEDIERASLKAEKAGKSLTKAEKLLLDVLKKRAEQQRLIAEESKEQAELDIKKAEILTTFQLSYEELAKKIDESRRRQDEYNESINSAEAKADRLIMKMKDLEYQTKLNADAWDMWTDRVRETESHIKEMELSPIEVPVDLLPPPPQEVNQVFQGIKDTAVFHLSGLMTDLLTGDADEMSEYFSALFQEIGEDASEQLRGMFSNVLSGRKPGGEGELTGIGDLFSGEDANTMWQNIGMTIGAGMMQYGKKKQNKGLTIAGGAVQGFMRGGVVGMVVGAVAAYLSTRGKDKTPSTAMRVGAGGVDISTKWQGGSEEVIDTAQRQIMNEFSATEQALRNMVKGFGSIEIMGLLSGALPTWQTAGWKDEGKPKREEGSLQAFVDYLTKGGLMQAFMEQRYAPLMLQGLEQTGMDQKYIKTILEQIGQLTSDQQIKAMEQLISAAVGVTKAGEQGYEGFREQALMNETEALWSRLGGFTDSMMLSVTGLESMKPSDRISEWQNLGTTLDQVGDNVGKFIQQLEALRESIKSQASGLIEQLDLRKMDTSQQTRYFMDKILSINQQLAGATGKDEIQRLTSEAFGYQQQLMGLLGDDTRPDRFSGPWQSLENWLREQIAVTETTGEERINALEDTAQSYYETALEQVAFFGESIGIAGDTILGFVDAWAEEYKLFGEGRVPTVINPGNSGGGTVIEGGTEHNKAMVASAEVLAMTGLKDEIIILSQEVLSLRQQYQDSSGKEKSMTVRVEPLVDVSIEMAPLLKGLIKIVRTEATIVAEDIVLRYDRLRSE